jgi:fructose-1-phosphate kinase PfkB-like protein
VSEQGAHVKSETWEKLMELVRHNLAKVTFLAICDNFPASIPQDGLATLLRRTDLDPFSLW